MNSLAPALLVSMPQMMDPNFVRTVILLCQHDDSGAFGLVLNRPAATTGRVTVNLHPPISIDHELQIWLGGPVEPERSWILVWGSAEEAPPEDSITIGDRMYLSTSPILLRRVLEPNPPDRMRLIVGYAGWGAGQLEHELRESAWLMSDADAALVFETTAEQMWEAVIRRLGADPAALQGSRGVH
jgi:putative transcriptional regulator